MTHLVFVSLCLFVVCAGNVKASSKYKECTVYATGEKKPEYPECRFCAKTFDSKEYCREYSCAATTCKSTDVVKGANDCCGSCPGTCNYGGRIYNVNDTFLCLDGSNRCSCAGTGVIISTRKGYSQETVCEPRYYGACTLYNEWEQKDRNLERQCIKDNLGGREIDVCEEYKCGSIWFHCKEEDLVKNDYDGCKSCPDTCNYGGRVYAVGKSFKCLDGVNTCRCISTGRVSSTYIAQSKESMCKRYGDNCVVYGPGDVPDSSKCRYCQREYSTPWALYCKEYTCAETTCENPVKHENDCCASCPDTCNYGGKVYNVKDSFTCLDGGNYCSCMGTGAISSTLMGVPKETLLL